jgi:hypothetical protein
MSHDDLRLWGGNALKPSFVEIAHIGSLLDFDHFNFLKDFKAMAAGDQEDSIARFENAAFQVLLLVSVKIDAEFTGFDEQDFLSVGDLARNGIVDVGRDDFTRRVVHVGKLLGELVWSKKVNTGLVKAMGNDQG